MGRGAKHCILIMVFYICSFFLVCFFFAAAFSGSLKRLSVFEFFFVELRAARAYIHGFHPRNASRFNHNIVGLKPTLIEPFSVVSANF